MEKVKVMILPLINKSDLVKKAEEVKKIIDMFSTNVGVIDAEHSYGRRLARAKKNNLATITVDHQTLETNEVKCTHSTDSKYDKVMNLDDIFLYAVISMIW